jgi:hypothetical protein
MSSHFRRFGSREIGVDIQVALDGQDKLAATEPQVVYKPWE